MTANKNLYQSKINGCHKIAVNYKFKLIKNSKYQKKTTNKFPRQPKTKFCKNALFFGSVLLKTKKKSHN